MEKLTAQEEEIMIYIWKLGPCFIKDIVACFPEPHPPYTTIASIVKNLERKKHISSKRYGNTYEYTPIIEQQDYKKRFLNNVVKNYFKDSYKEMVSFFAKEQNISAEELKEIIQLIEKEEEK